MLSIRPATIKDVSLLTTLIHELAEYERLSHETSVTDEDIVRDGFGPDLKFRAVISLAIVVALPIRSSAKPRFGKEALVNLALLAQRDFRFVDIQLPSEVFRHLSREFFLPKCV